MVVSERWDEQETEEWLGSTNNPGKSREHSLISLIFSVNFFSPAMLFGLDINTPLNPLKTLAGSFNRETMR